MRAVGTGLIIIWARDGNLRLIAHSIHNIGFYWHYCCHCPRLPGESCQPGKDKIQPHCVPVFEASYNPKQKDKFSKKS
jgi:hypothetical protein